MSTAKLPDGWTRVKFGDVVRNSNENSRDLKADGIDRVIGLDHLDPGSLRLVRWDNLADLPHGTTFTRKFKPGQVLFGKRRAYQRKVAVPDFEGVCSGDILVFEPADKRMLAEFVPYVVQSDGFFDHALGTSAGSLSPRTKWVELARYEFALPPLDEQQRIVALVKAVDCLLGALVSVDVAVLRKTLVSRALEATDLEIPLSEVISLEYGKGLSEASRDGGEYPVVGSSGVVGLHSIPLTTDDRTIVVGRKGTAGSVQLIESRCWPIDTTYFVRLKTDLPLDFVFAQLQTMDFDSVITATAVPGLIREDAYKLRFRIPDSVTIDDLIAALRQCASLGEWLVSYRQQLRLARVVLLNVLMAGERVH
jgi:type I restriction enzyme S subunit